MPASQLIFCVGLLEIDTSAYAAALARSNAAIAIPTLIAFIGPSPVEPLSCCSPRRLHLREVGIGVVGGASQRRGRHHQEAFGAGDRLQRFELVGRPEAVDRRVLL